MSSTLLRDSIRPGVTDMKRAMPGVDILLMHSLSQRAEYDAHVYPSRFLSRAEN